jgi:WhiB family transcriptional regulator, redox-sensing transcriptional regulator
MNEKNTEGSTSIRPLTPAIPNLAAALIGPWTARASCTETDPEVFFPPHGDPATQARQICAQCPVRDDCLAYALDADERYGIWGGLDPDERRSLHRRQRRQPLDPTPSQKGVA